MRFLLRTISILFIMSGLAFGQLYQGPASGSVSSGATYDTGTKDNFVPGANMKKHGPHNIFTNLLLSNPIDLPAPTGPEGSNFMVDPLIGKTGNSTQGVADDFELTTDFQGIPDLGTSIPPDPYFAVGPDYVMGVVNTRIRCWDKNGVEQFTKSAATWFSSALSGASPFDPKVIYDHFAERWVMVWLHWPNASSAKYLISVSDDDDPNGTWYSWAIPSNSNGNTTTTNAADYQGVGYDQDNLYITSNQFTDAGSYQYCKFRVIDKTALYANTAGALNWDDLWDIKDGGGNNVFGIRPTRVYGTPSSYYLVARSVYSTGTYFTVYTVNTSGTLSMTATNVPVTAYSDPNDAAQLGSAHTIDGGGDGLRNEPVYRDGYLHLTHSVKNGAYSAVNYTKINLSTNTAVTDVAMGADTYYHFYPALEVDGNNNVVITYTRSATSEYAGAYYTTLPTTQTTLTGSKLLQAGNSTYYKTFGGTRNRWGDYMGAWLDPDDNSKIWVFTEFVPSTNTWGTWVGELTFTQPTNYVLVTAPNGGELYAVGDNTNITWQSSGVSTVTIELSVNNGQSWSTIASGVSASSGSYAWTVPNNTSTTCLIRINGSLKSGTSDESNNVFTISSGGLDWVEVTSGLTGEIWGIDWVDENIVWACANEGDVILSTDGGSTWSGAGNPAQGAYSIAALSATTALVSTGPDAGNGAIYRTTDGGSSWTQVYTATGAWFNFIDNIDDNNIWAQSDPIGTIFHIVKSTDGGVTWAAASQRPSQPASDVFGANGSFYRVGNTAWFGTGGQSGATKANRVYKTDNVPDGPWTYGTLSEQFVGTVAFSSETGNGLAGFWSSSASDKVDKSSNGGSNWSSQAAAGIGDVLGLDYIRGTNYCWAATSNGIFETSNNGSTWSPNTIPPTVTGDINVVRFYQDSDVGLAGGSGGVLLKSLLGSVVPVEFTSFTANAYDRTINLNWTTATETNNSGFEVQRNIDGDWVALAFVPGQGTTTDVQAYSFNDNLDESFVKGKVSYRLKQIDFDGTFAYSEQVNVNVDLTPEAYVLHQNYPNPFNPTTVISYELPENGLVSLRVYDVLGKEVAVLANEKQNVGKYEVNFDASALSSGVYFYRLEVNGFTSMKKLLLLK
jgi:hypothetical protein